MSKKEKSSKINKILLFVLIFYFSALSIFHFIRLTFSWDILIKGAFGEHLVPSYISGFCIIFSLLIILKAKKLFSKNKVEKINNKEEY